MLAGVKTLIYQHGPTILTIGGIVGVVGSGVMACRATVKVTQVKIEIEADIATVKETPHLDDKTYKKALTRTYINAGRRYARLYGPPILLGALSIGAILYGHNILNKKTMMLAGAYKALTMNFDDYRDRVKERLGEDIERSVAFDTQTMTIEDLKGNEQTIEYVPEEMCGNPTSDRSVFFDDTSIYWCDEPEENKRFLMDLQEKAQKKFDRDGYLLLNWIYKHLDVPETYAGAHCGWAKGFGDDVISFGIHDIHSAASRRFVNGLEPVILLNFNDDGYILDKI